MDVSKKIVGQKIQKIIYSEVNNHKGEFYFDGFDTFDFAINIQMQNDFWWHLAWKDDDFFEFGKGLYQKNSHLSLDIIKSWEANNRWIDVLNSSIINFKISHIDKAKLIPSLIEISFENGKKIKILIAEELNADNSIPFGLKYDFSGRIYVIHNLDILKEIEV